MLAVRLVFSHLLAPPPPPPLIFSSAVLAQITDTKAIFSHAALKNPNFESPNCRKKLGNGQSGREKKDLSVENRFSPAGSPLQQTSKAEAAATSVAASIVSGSSIESLQSRKVCVGERRLRFLRLRRPAGLISGRGALLLDILLRRRRRLLFSS